MLIKIPLLSFLVFGFTYPLFFWLTAKNPIKHYFHRFHLACPVLIAGLAIVSLWFLPVPQGIRNAAAAWLCCALVMTAIFWHKEDINRWLVTSLCFWGLWLFAVIYSFMVNVDGVELFISLLAGFIVAGIFYAMNLGHFYLNVHGLPIRHLKNATIAFGVLLTVRLLWDLIYLPKAVVMVAGEPVALLSWINSVEGMMLWVAIFFGTIFPLGGLYFALGTLKLKNTQATTGILYVLLSAVLLGDLAYKYYLLKYSVPL